MGWVFVKELVRQKKKNQTFLDWSSIREVSIT